jgi:FKBP-type peptidyl-prolyl cis-trans isomerase
MNKIMYAALAVSLLAIPTLSNADDTLKTDKDKVSYSMGAGMGRDLHAHDIDIDPKVLAIGLQDALSGGKLKMTDEEMQSTMEAFAQAMHDKAKAKGVAYLEANKKKDGWKVTASGLQYKVLTTGTGPIPKASDTVVTQYRGTTIDGTEFDSSYKRNEPAEFQVGGVIPGWSEALQLMPVGSKWQLAIPSDLAYGDNPPPQSGIGPDQVLLFDVELVKIDNSAPAPGGPGDAGGAGAAGPGPGGQ